MNITQFNDRIIARYLEMNGNKIKCPYCNKMVDVNDLNSKKEVVSSKVSFPWYLPNSMKITYYRADIPICSSCISVFSEAREKSMRVSLIFFTLLFAIESILCYLEINEDAWWGLILLDVPLFFITRFIICYILVKNKGIKYHVKRFA